jgi:hypothetical protein
MEEDTLTIECLPGSTGQVVTHTFNMQGREYYIVPLYEFADPVEYAVVYPEPLQNTGLPGVFSQVSSDASQ